VSPMLKRLDCQPTRLPIGSLGNEDPRSSDRAALGVGCHIGSPWPLKPRFLTPGRRAIIYLFIGVGLSARARLPDNPLEV